ncbi:hypothetical protein BD324DRAFT_468189 [Kockovaella imperatae]|uniref:Uncharacterized protein n=1 Tax=Kockovaella imperatae TaxID=4999 RepID=A0A1Y1UFF1_9TREE|nr:hypothetical protein BD324DRAFT_468189 [Kockovaella imperatae]ORX36791.1 hypothetical protein BD324DRAFT_468189 [Kockovaella imperatae]
MLTRSSLSSHQLFRLFTAVPPTLFTYILTLIVFFFLVLSLISRLHNSFSPMRSSFCLALLVSASIVLAAPVPDNSGNAYTGVGGQASGGDVFAPHGLLNLDALNFGSGNAMVALPTEAPSSRPNPVC